MCIDEYSYQKNYKLTKEPTSQAILNKCGVTADEAIFDGVPAEHWIPDKLLDCAAKAPSLELRIARQVAGVTIKCLVGQAVVYIKKDELGFKYNVRRYWAWESAFPNSLNKAIFVTSVLTLETFSLLEQ